jgi:hypothetical protein
MALQTSGLITLQDLQDEFGGSDPIKMSQFYRGGTLVPDFSLNNSVPTSGTIKLSDFYGASKGIQVDYILIGGGGAGGFGLANGTGTGSGGNGAGTTFVKDGSALVTANGGAGGVNARDNGTGTGGPGEDSSLNTNTGGNGGSPNAAGSPGTGGGGGGGGGGDAPSRYDASGAAGGGGNAGVTQSGVLFTGPGAYTLNTGNGGTSAGGNYNGGRGGSGYASITQPATRRDQGTSTNAPLTTIYWNQDFGGGGSSNAGRIYDQPIIGAPLTNTWSRFWDNMYVNRTDENDTNNPYSVTEMGNYDKIGSGRLYIAHKNDYTGSTFYNDTPIAAIQILDQPGTTVLHNWWFNTSNNWETYTAVVAGDSTSKPGTPGNIPNNWATVGTGYSTTRFQLRSSTSSSRTGAEGGINNPGTTPMTLGQETVSQSSSTNYLFREVSGSNPRYSFNYCRSPSITWQPGYRIRMAYIIGNRSASTYDADDTLFAAIV